MSEASIDQGPSTEAVERLRARLANDAGTVMVFPGAGLSFAIGRAVGRGGFETPPPLDDARFPSWPLLVDRMRARLVEAAGDGDEAHDLERFMRSHDPLDAAQLFRLRMGPTNTKPSCSHSSSHVMRMRRFSHRRTLN